ncbi:hypothetical protein EXIGLDRAFT_780805 [Exidia glandulosa HHB12029]|uniref:Uncharacterized protein n=1 Tax=Exidia glandulosa HHB12029 TaxID=1314781 RepID=A0A165Z9C5_EXIGL|nr:hypothetical protein EXIGLDRAFT_780805 [Exidia glandulosa HHB12029]
MLPTVLVFAAILSDASAGFSVPPTMVQCQKAEFTWDSYIPGAEIEIYLKGSEGGDARYVEATGDTVTSRGGAWLVDIPPGHVYEFNLWGLQVLGAEIQDSTTASVSPNPTGDDSCAFADDAITDGTATHALETLLPLRSRPFQGQPSSTTSSMTRTTTVSHTTTTMEASSAGSEHPNPPIALPQSTNSLSVSFSTSTFLQSNIPASPSQGQSSSASYSGDRTHSQLRRSVIVAACTVGAVIVAITSMIIILRYRRRHRASPVPYPLFGSLPQLQETGRERKRAAMELLFRKRSPTRAQDSDTGERPELLREENARLRDAVAHLQGRVREWENGELETLPSYNSES